MTACKNTAVLQIEAQPDDSSCGPTCLHAVYRHYGDPVPLSEVSAAVARLPTGGTVAVLLACHALRRGYSATIYSYNLQIFDPTWFELDRDELGRRLVAQAAVKRDPKLSLVTQAYLRYLELGGRIAHEELGETLLARLLGEHGPLLTGLSATYLYDCKREVDGRYDDIAGEPTGHFVVLHDFDLDTHTVDVADPLTSNPAFPEPHYRIAVNRLVAAILLGTVTYDANLLLIEPGG
ncbi:MAG TPA: hypothetical protein VMS86_07050 [Thermoanaerobaculia bacterium]|nr:hypothetical protein [Thermoanaerobaculia bacterium]